MTDATIRPRAGISPAALEEATYWHPLKAPDLWLTREEAAEALHVGSRTIDRYTRADKLTTYVGPIPGGGRGVRVLKSEVDNWTELHVKVVTPDA
jgi:excisionase family DNA binding protein